MGSTLKVDNIVGTSGTSAPITLSGDNATLGSTVTFPDKIRDRDVWYPIHNGHSNSGDFLQVMIWIMQLPILLVVRHQDFHQWLE